MTQRTAHRALQAYVHTKQGKPSLDWYWRLGRIVASLAPRSDSGYDRQVVALLEKLGPVDHKARHQLEKLLYAARAFAETYELHDLTRLAPLAWSHACLLVSVDDPD